MGVIVLLGGFNAGLSPSVQLFAHACQNKYKVIDTDKAIAQDPPFSGNIYKIYSYSVVADDTSIATEYIAEQERQLLKELAYIKEPCVIAAGPLLPSREPEWSRFVESVNPTCFYFRARAQEMYASLKRRRVALAYSGLSAMPGFGSWDKDLATTYNRQAGTWEALPEEIALPWIERHISRLDLLYKRVCPKHRWFDATNLMNDFLLQRELEESLAYHLDQDTEKDLDLVNASGAINGISAATASQRWAQNEARRFDRRLAASAQDSDVPNVGRALLELVTAS